MGRDERIRIRVVGVLEVKIQAIVVRRRVETVNGTCGDVEL